MSESTYLRMVSVNLGVRGQFELSLATNNQRIVVLEHRQDGLALAASFPPQLIPFIVSFAETFAMDHNDAVDLRQPDPTKTEFWPQKGEVSPATTEFRPVEFSEINEPKIPNGDLPVEVGRATVEHVGDDVIVTPVGLEISGSES